MKKTLFLIIAMVAGGSLMAQTLGQNELAELKASFNNDALPRASTTSSPPTRASRLCPTTLLQWLEQTISSSTM